MADPTPDATTPETVPSLRSLPRRAQLAVSLLLIFAIVPGILHFNRENGGGDLADPGATLPSEMPDLESVLAHSRWRDLAPYSGPDP